ncbi:oxidoreductase, aldo/keto reductase family [Myxococcus xanthus DK 1622]|uniref:Oxidoreductase, aldo/keto reductase family n=1 Tax=Myxococcus xanthus (strain DK1622) TaxID=246197 RepID=Q1D590_MYXXD|nr:MULTISPECIES: aldo/keto reductase [Myxococcus]ABF92556.1 oxidoreductase, aldo/keto reductase family [Myxococcus xanthus DK 1622]NOJ51573.1 aldo/keto reductase [Myxococcus xanthus]QPM76624.1 aldo/keto reductase [Myxococcus xanthus]QVW65687.1 aldo/keto reductase [Myxococcus xanthus DZ2]QZZ51692.1 1-deoxyxylulose-5-phosphate synthase YajO [Myxococcus xanthus]
MKYTNLGRTGLRVSRLGLGCMSYGTPKWRPWVLDEEAAQPFFRRAVELGINFFDTADMYSLGASEEITGRALRRYARMDEVVLATKVYFPMGDGQNMRGLSRKHIVQGCEASLKRLGVEAIDLYQIHRMDPNTPLEETLAALDQLVRQGKVRYLGASSAYAWQFARALGVADLRGWTRFVSMQGHYNLVYREEEREMLPLCEAEGIGVIPWSPLARGLLAGSRKSLKDRDATTRAKSDTLSPMLYDQASDWDVAEANRSVAEKRNVPPAQTALAWLLSRPAVTAPIIGATKLEHLEDAVRAVDLKLTADEVKALEAPYQPHAVRGL